MNKRRRYKAKAKRRTARLLQRVRSIAGAWRDERSKLSQPTFNAFG